MELRRSGLLALILTVPFVLSFKAEPPPEPAQEEKEPPLVLSLESQGKKVPIEVDRPFDLETKEGKTNFVLRMEPYRVFEHAGLSFHYPRGFSFQAQIQPAVSIWTLSSGTGIVIIQKFPDNAEHQAIMSAVRGQMIKLYKPENVKQSEVTVMLQKIEVKGTRLEVVLAQQTIQQTFVSLLSGKDSVILILQDTLKEGGKSSREAGQMLKMIQETFRFPGK